MNKLAVALIATLALIGCTHVTPPDQPHRVGINLGKQLGLVTLAAGSNNDVNIAPNGSTSTFVRFAVNASGSTLSGVSAALASVGDGDMFVFRVDSGTAGLTITNEDTASVAANRFKTPGDVSLTLPLWSSALVEYDTTVNRWVASLANPNNPTFTGNVTANGAAGIPVQSTCGTSPSIVAGSTSFAGTFTTGSAATTCTLTFAVPFGVAPTCVVVSAAAAAVLIPTYTTSTTALTLSVDIASTAYQYVCIGH